MRGKFIVIEGLDGSGKSTQAKRLAENLSSKDSLLTREPTGENIGSLVRAAFSSQISMQNSSILLLLIADRIEHLADVVEPALKSGRDVVCDRYYLSNIAYQARDDKHMHEIYSLNKKFGALKPDLTIFLSLAPSTAMERIKSRNMDKSIFEEFKTLERINTNYMKAIELLKSQGENVAEISATSDEDTIAAEILETVRSLNES